MLKVALVMSVVVMVTSCASSYQQINPSSLNYKSSSLDKGVLFEYKYELLEKKYKKKELEKGVRLVAIKLTNNSNEDLVFGNDIKLTYYNGNSLSIMNSEQVFTNLKQKPASYLWYLLLSPFKSYNQENVNGFSRENSGVVGDNMEVAGSANRKFKQDLLNYDINGRTIKKGETVSGLIGIKSYDYNAIKVAVN